MVRIDTRDPTTKWRFVCPTPHRHRTIRAVNGEIECRQCGETFGAVFDLETGEEIPRSDIEFVGPHADSKGRFGSPTVE